MTLFPEGWEVVGCTERQWIYNLYACACFSSQYKEAREIYDALTEDQGRDLTADLLAPKKH